MSNKLQTETNRDNNIANKNKQLLIREQCVSLNLSAIGDKNGLCYQNNVRLLLLAQSVKPLD